jgi:hypothetical protein
MSSRGAVPTCVLFAGLLAGCAASPAIEASPSAAPSIAIASVVPSMATPAISVQATQAPMVSPSPAPIAIAGFTTPLPPDPAATWTGISWQQLDPNEPLAHVRSISRWSHGYVAVGGVLATGNTSHTPIWMSTDGGTWAPLPVAALGAAAVVVGVGRTAEGVAVLTLQGGANQCDGDDPLYCWTLAGPLQVWTLNGGAGTTWASHAGPPALALPDPGCGGCGADVPFLRAGSPGLILFNASGHIFISSDGAAWDDLPSSALPAGFHLGDIEGFGASFVAVGAKQVTTNGELASSTVALTSADGRHWEAHALGTGSLGPAAGVTAGNLVIGASGLMAVGSTGADPGLTVWWSSGDGVTWHQREGYPPLGIWNGQGAGSGDMPNGFLVGNGDRMLAYRDDKVGGAWMSNNGASWVAIKVANGWPALVPGYAPGIVHLTPIGVLGTGSDGSSWFGLPTT